MELKDKDILITGAASGIGRLMAEICLQKGCKSLLVWDIDQKGLEAFKLAQGANSAKVFHYQVDLSDANSIESAALKVKSEHGGVDVLINNAGVVFKGQFKVNTKEQIQKTMEINAIAPMLVTHHFLSQMLERPKASICTIASSAGLISNPGMVIYAASKWAATGWSDSLYLELKSKNSSVHITTVMPFYISTGMFEGVRSKVLPILKPEKVARQIIEAIEKEKRMLALPLSYRMIRMTQAILPTRVYDWIMEDVLGIYRTMDHFKGRG